MGKIKFGSSSYSFEDIRNGHYTCDNTYIQTALSFCRQWLLGVKSFELQTSGSTGTPKTISVLRRQMESSAAATRLYFGIQNGAKLLCCLNTDLVAGKMMLVRALEWDADCTLIGPTADPLADLPPTAVFDFVAMVPMQVANSIAKDFPSFKNIGVLIIGGAPTPPELLHRLATAQVNAYLTYGMTETVSHVALCKITGEEPVYEALPGVKIGTDVEGRLVLEADMALEGRVQTNDIVQLISANAFRWIGRADFTINSGGIKLQPETIEKTLASFMSNIVGNRAYFVAGIPDPILGESLVLVIEGPKLADKMLEEFKQILPKFHAPKSIYYIPKFVRTPSGKINRIQTLNLIP
jgi:o-succinylbenzoate---CoA ligase